ncbi:hypothetical protein ACO0LC_10520 [Undibacterium sp. JH2W]|uniref:hypothetical protein n=1 Tax=Undibacterium sp. JH2W TaxID=3413037 RepID=UPI003BF0C20E
MTWAQGDMRVALSGVLSITMSTDYRVTPRLKAQILARRFYCHKIQASLRHFLTPQYFSTLMDGREC